MSRVKINILSNIIGQLSLLVIGLFVTSYIFHGFGADVLGIIYFSSMLNTVITNAFSLGVRPLIIREVAAHIQSDKEYTYKLTRTASFVFWGGYLVLAVGVYQAMPYIVEHWIHLNTMPSEEAKKMMSILLITSLLAIPNTVYLGIFDGLQRMEYPNAINVFIIAIQQSGMLVLLVMNSDVQPVIYWMAACFVSKSILNFMGVSRIFPMKALIPCFNLSVIRRNMAFSLRMAVISLLSMIQTQADKVILSKLLLIEMLGYYAVAYSHVSKITFFAQAIAKASYPVFSKLIVKGEKEKSLKHYHEFQEMVCYSTVPIVAGLAYFNQAVFTFVFNAEVAGILVYTVLFLSLAMFIQAVSFVPHFYLLSSSKEKIVFNQSVYSVFISVVTALFGIYYFGLVGAGAAMCFSRIFVLAYVVPKLSRECLNMTASHFYFNLLRVSCAGVGSYGVMWGIVEVFSQHFLVNDIGAYLMASVMYMLVTWYLLMPSLKAKVFSLMPCWKN